MPNSGNATHTRYSPLLAASTLICLAVLGLAGGGCEGGKRSPDDYKGRALMSQLNNAQLDGRIDAAKELGRMRYGPAIDHLIRLLVDVREEVRVAGATALGDLGDERAVAPLSRLLTSGEWMDRRAAADAMGRIGKQACVEPLRAALKDKEVSVSGAAAFGLAGMGDIGLPPLLDVLAGENRELRSTVVLALAGRGGRSAMAPLEKCLADPLPAIRESAAKGIARIGGNDAMPVIAGLLTHTDAGLRKKAAELLTQAGTNSLPTLGSLLDNPDPGVRAAGIGVLTSMAVPETALVLLSALTNRNEDVRKGAWDFLAVKRGSTERKALFREQFAKAQGKLRVEILRLLVAVADKDMSDLAVSASTDPDADMRLLAVMMMRKAGTPTAQKGLIALLQDSDDGVRFAGAAALTGWNLPRAYDVLAQVLRDAAGAKDKRPPAERTAKAIELLSHARDPRLSELLPPLLDKSDPTMLVKIAQALTAIEDPRAFDNWIRLLKSSDKAAVSASLQALGALRDKRATDHLIPLLASPDISSLPGAIKALAAIEDPRAFEPLIPLLKSTNKVVLVGAIQALGGLHDKRAAEHLIPLMNHGDEDVKTAAMLAFGDTRDPRAFDRLLPLVGPSETQMVHCVVEAIGRTRDPRAFDFLVKRYRPVEAGLLKDAGSSRDQKSPTSFQDFTTLTEGLCRLGDERVLDVVTNALYWTAADMKGPERTLLEAAMKTVSSIEHIGGTRAYDTIVGRFRHSQMYDNKVERWHRPNNMFKALSRLDPKRAIGTLTELIRTEPLHCREEIKAFADILVESRDPRAVSALAEFLLTDLPENRIMAIDALKRMGPLAVPPLIGMLKETKDTSESRRSAIAIALSEIGEPAVAPLVELLKDKSPEARRGAAWTLGQMDDPCIAPALLQSLADENPDVQGAVIWALGQLKDKRAVSPLTEKRKDSKAIIRAAVVEALGAIGDGQAAPTVREMLKDETPAVRTAACAALAVLAGATPETLEALRGMLNDSDANVRGAADAAIKNQEKKGRATPRSKG